MALNCWEFKKCGREPNGARVNELGVCPAATNRVTHGINHGVNGGRCCWALVGTLCGNKVQGSFTSKMAGCMNCEFYKNVWKEEKQRKTYTDTKEILKLSVRK